MQVQTNYISYHNKDITSKIFAEKFKGKSLKVYGIDLPRIKQVLPTNLPIIQANELRMDNLFLLEDDTFLVIDYESDYKSTNKLKYLEYVLRVLKQYNKEYGMEIKIFVVVIYTADVLERQTRCSLDVGSVSIKIKQAFLSEMDSDNIKKRLTEKVQQGRLLLDEELMQYIILPLAYRGMEEKKQTIKELFDLAKYIKEEDTQLFLLSGILVFTDKVIDEETAKRIKEWIHMTKVARLFEEEKEEAVKQAAERAAEQEARETAIEMLKDGNKVEKIVKYVRRLSILDVEKLKQEIENK